MAAVLVIYWTASPDVPFFFFRPIFVLFAYRQKKCLMCAGDLKNEKVFRTISEFPRMSNYNDKFFLIFFTHHITL